MTFKIGDRVEKWTGDYVLTGEVRAVYTTKRGEIRYVVEPDVIGLQLIYSPHQLRGANNDAPLPVYNDPNFEYDERTRCYRRRKNPMNVEPAPASLDATIAPPKPDYTNARGETSKPMALSEEEKQDRAELCTISINGHVHTLRVGAVISYADACTIAHRPHDSTIVWSIMDGPSGRLMPGDNVIAERGLRISVIQIGAA